MSTVAFFVAQLAALAAGGALLFALGGRQTGLKIGLLLPAAWLAGTGMFAVERLLLAQLNLGLGWVVMLAPWVLIAGIAAYRYFGEPSSIASATSPTPMLLRAIDMGVATLVVVWTAFLWWRTTHQALNGWDAWAIWFFKGRAFFQSGTVAPAFLTNSQYATYAHMDYPLLVPLTVAQTYAFTGDAEMLMKGWWALLAGAAAAGLYWGLEGLASRASRFAGLLFVLTLPDLLRHAAGELTGYADLPLAVLTLYGAIFLYRRLNNGKQLEFVAAALFFGLAGFTKNEGLVVAGAGLLVLFGAALRVKRPGWEALGALGLAAVILLPWQVEKAVLGIKGDINPSISGMLARAGERIGPIASGLWQHATSIERLNLIVPVLLVLGLGALYFSPGKCAKTLPLLLLLATQIAGAVAAYFASPYDINWHISTSADRVVFQWVFLGILLSTLYIDAVLGRIPLRVSTRHLNQAGSLS